MYHCADAAALGGAADILKSLSPAKIPRQNHREADF